MLADLDRIIDSQRGGFRVACELEPIDLLPAPELLELSRPDAPCPDARLRRTATRRNLRISTADGVACSVMVGIGENYLPAFALALGAGEVLAGLIASVPIFAGAVLQLISPTAIRLVGSNRRWVVVCVSLQAMSFLPMLAAAIVGHISTPLLFLLAALYWGAGMASGPAWNHWIDTLVPLRIRARYMGRRSRSTQFGILAGFAGGGLALAYGESLGRPLWAFAMLFLVASACRFASAGFLFAQSEPARSVGRNATAGLRGAFGRLRSHRDGRLLIYLWAMQMAAQTAAPFYAPFMLASLKFSYLKYMLIVSAALATKALALPTLGMIAHRFGSRRLLVLGGLTVIPLSMFWIFSQATGYLLCLQVASGIGWATYELGTLLMCFDAVDRRQRVGMLTLYNLGNAAAMVAGSLCGGGILALLGQARIGYFAIFAISGVARLSTVPLLMRIGGKTTEAEAAPATVKLLPEFAAPGDRPMSRAA